MKINRTTVGAERAISLLPAKPILAVLLSVLLIVSLFPMIQPAYGEGAFDAPVSDVADTAIDGELSDELAPEEDAVEGVEDDAAATEAAEGDGSADESTLGGDGDSDDPAAEALAAEADVDESQVGEPAALSDWNGDQSNANNLVVEGEKIANLRYTNGGTYTLTVNGTLKGTVYVTGGTTLTINGTGTINGNGAPTVIHVEGGGSVLNINKDDDDVLKITGGAGGTKLNDAQNFPDYFGGGGILVQRKDGEGASLNLHNGKVYNNWAGAGGGIYIDRDCSFYMANGEVSGNSTAVQTRDGVAYPAHEAGGIYVAGHSVQGTDSQNNSSAHTYIAKATITDNSTATTTDWGGGGIFIESKGVLKLGTAKITQNTARGLGGGVSGCPHAVIGMGSITNQSGAAIWANTAQKSTKPFNSFLTVSQLQNGQRYGDMYAYGLYRTDFKSGELASDDDRRAGVSNDAGLKELIGKGYFKDAFLKDYAQDYYCTKVSAVTGPNVSEVLVNNDVWKGYAANAFGGSAFTIKKGEVRAFSTGSVGLTSLLPDTYDAGERAVVIMNNTSATHGGGIGCNGVLLMGDLPEGAKYNSMFFDFGKTLKNSLGENLGVGNYRFSFELKDTKTKETYYADSDANGRVTFQLPGEDFLKDLSDGAEKTVNFELRELPNRSYPDIVFDSTVHKVELTFKASVQSAEIVSGKKVTTHSFADTKISIDGIEPSDFAVTNMQRLSGYWSPWAKKFVAGGLSQESGKYSFELTEVTDPKGDLANAKPVENGVKLTASNGEFEGDDGNAKVVFSDIFYTERGEKWYTIRETNGSDATVYVVKIVVTGNHDDNADKPSTALSARVTEVLYAESPESGALTALPSDGGQQAVPEFFNNNDEAFSLAGYRVNALSGAPVSQKCLVDPKIIKQLEGRTLTPGEFSFQLIEVNDYADTTGTVISETSNDADGMVDFDAAANKADPGWEPSCLLFTQPGLYKYRVIEDPKQKGDPSIDYSQQVITFTVQVELNDGVLAATDMYYGYLNEAGENVRYKEQYTDWELKEQDPAWSPSINDYADLDTSWHPTMTNRAKPMDLAVRKTSVLDRTEGLEGATYALYLANFGGEADIRLANATSDDGGWLYFEDVALKTGNLYYFMEEAAPEGHTVSKFRSKYFYLVPDAAAPNGYVMKYADSRDALDGSDDLVAQVAGGAEGDDTFGGNEAAPDVDGTTTEPVTGKDGALLFVYEADGGVYDEATYVEFNKLDTRNHEWVEGAKLSIVEKESGQVVNAWVSGKAPEVLQKALNVDTVYVLREDEAPEGYEKAADVEFRIDSFGAVEILSGTENGNAELTGSTIVLYDTRIPVEEVVTETRERVRELPSTGPKTADKLAKTGDAVPLFAVGLVALAALVVLVAAARRNRKRGNHAR